MAMYRCYFFRDSHIKAVEELRCVNDDDARGQVLRLLAERSGFERIEVWDRDRKVDVRPTSTAA